MSETTENDFLQRWDVEVGGDGDTEAARGKADKIMSDALRSLGWTRLADAFDSMEKWYA